MEEHTGQQLKLKQQKKNKMVQEILGVLVLLVLCIHVNAENDIHRYFFTVNATITVSVLSIDYSSCTHPGMKLNYYPYTSKSDGVEVLVYNELYMPYKLVTSDATKVGIDKIRIERNNSFLIVRFYGISALAIGGVFCIHQICGVTQFFHENEHWFKFILVYPTTAANSMVTSFTSTTATEKPIEETETEFEAKKVWIGATIVGILFLLIIVGLIAKFFCSNRGNSVEETPCSKVNV